MNITKQTTEVIASPSGNDLLLTLFKSKEGVEQFGVSTYEGVVTFKELAENFKAEENSDVLDESVKKQRDVDSRRINGLKEYWKISKGTVFPSMTLAVNDLRIHDKTVIGNREIITATITKDADRFICDGQGRTTFIQWLLAEAEQNLVQFGEHTMAFKLIVTHTQNLFCPSATRILKQIFADYHSKLVKPSASISKSFDSSTAFARLLQELQEIEIDGKPIKKRISQQGKIKHGQLWSYAQFMSVIQKMLNITKKEAATHFETDENYQMSKELCTGFLKQVFTILPLQLLDSDEQRVHANMMFTKAIFANGLGYVGRSLFEEMLIDESVTWEKLKNLTLPIADKDDKAWLSHKVTMKDGNTIKIIKGTDKRIAALICNEMRIFPCHAITL